MARLGRRTDDRRWPTIHDHLLNVICAGDQEHHAYLLGWLAHCVQHPERQAEVAVVLQGRKGTGKGRWGRCSCGSSATTPCVTHTRHLVGHFNAHLVDALFLFLDEAVWAGDKQGEGVLKGSSPNAR